MDVTKLWEELTPPKTKDNKFIKDVSEGKVPQLPFYIVDQADLKGAIKNKIENIDSTRMTTSVILANYGNGKTNVLKYLELFYNKTYPAYNVRVQYTRADPERTDLVVFLLKMVQDVYLDKLILAIKEICLSKIDYNGFANDFEESFIEIKEYADILFSKSDDEEIKNLIYMGTGRLSNKRYFDKYKMGQLKDFHRREVLVLFLNILSNSKEYIIFGIDEVEKIIEKSKVRFNHFLTSYRELIDLFNKVNGHYIILAITDGSDGNLIRESNEALHSRISGDLLPVNQITSNEDKKELIQYLSGVFQEDVDIEEILSQLKKLGDEERSSNRRLIMAISRIIFKKDITYLSIEELVKSKHLEEIYDDTRDNLIKNDAFKNIHRKFFDPLEDYLESMSFDVNNIKKQERYFFDEDTQRLQYFIFNVNKDTLDNELMKIADHVFDREPNTMIVYAPEKLELNNSTFDDYEKIDIRIVDYDPEVLFVLLEIYRQNFDLQPMLKEIISNYTKDNL